MNKSMEFEIEIYEPALEIEDRVVLCRSKTIIGDEKGKYEQSKVN